eukprot:1151541-Prymnesium_polylepis.1
MQKNCCCVAARATTFRRLWPMAYGLWCDVRRYSSATRLCGASGTAMAYGDLLWPMAYGAP